MEEKDIINISEDVKPENNDIAVEEPLVFNYLSQNWNDEWEHHHGDIS